LTDPVPPSGTFVAFDYGSKRIGIAVGESTLGTAQPLRTVTNRHGTPDWHAINSLIDEWQPDALVVGVPLTADGADQPITGQSRAFVKKLHQRYSLPVFSAEERYTSNAAQRELATLRARGQRGRTAKSDVDTLAAALILEGWFADPSAPLTQPDS